MIQSNNLININIREILKSQNQGVLKRTDLKAIYESNANLQIQFGTNNFNDFITYILEYCDYRKTEFPFPFRKEIRYSPKEYSLQKRLICLDSKAYLSHYSAMFLNNLTEQIPNSIYINIEQPTKPTAKPTILTQDTIDKAFNKPPRLTSNHIILEGHEIHLLNGKESENLGIITIQNENGEDLRTSDLERTLIDITVRPYYSGGISEVMNAYRTAVRNIDIDKLLSYLSKQKYAYPYHQAIGFYLERCGMVNESDLAKFENIGMSFDFYLAHGISNLKYSSRWKLFYMAGV